MFIQLAGTQGCELLTASWCVADRDVESGKLSAGKVWERTDEVQNRTLDTVGKVPRVLSCGCGGTS